MQLAVKLSRVWAAIHHVEVGAVQPILFLTKLKFDVFKELCAGQRIRDRHTYVIGYALAHHAKCCFYVGATFARVSKLEEEGDLDARVMQAPRCRVNLLDTRAFVHGVENFLGAGFSAHPNNFATRLLQRLGYTGLDEVNPKEALE